MGFSGTVSEDGTLTVGGEVEELMHDCSGTATATEIDQTCTSPDDASYLCNVALERS